MYVRENRSEAEIASRDEPLFTSHSHRASAMPPTRAATGGLYEELYARHNYHGFSRFTTGTTVARVVTQDLKLSLIHI